MEKIQASAQLSSEVTLEIDKNEFGAKLDDITRIGDVVKNFLDGISGRFERDFAKDDIARAALQGAMQWANCVCVCDCM